MFHHEKVDSNIDEKYADYNHSELAQGFIRTVGVFGGWMLKEDPTNDLPQAYRIGTWVEQYDDRFGHALVLSTPKKIHHTIAEFSIQSLFYKVDRAHHRITEGPKVQEIRTTCDLKKQISQTRKTYDRDELIFSLGMLDKMRILALDGRFGDDIDKHVGFGLALEHADVLAQQNPATHDA